MSHGVRRLGERERFEEQLKVPEECMLVSDLLVKRNMRDIKTREMKRNSIPNGRKLKIFQKWEKGKNRAEPVSFRSNG